MALVTTVTGGALLVVAAVLILLMRRKPQLTSRDENVRMAAYLMAWFGSWLFLFGGWAYLVKAQVFRLRMTWLLGMAVGFLLSAAPAFIQAGYFLIKPERLERRPSPEEGLGNGSCLIFSALLSLLIGLVLGAVLGAVL